MLALKLFEVKSMMDDELMSGQRVLFCMHFWLALFLLTMTIYVSCLRKWNVVFFTYRTLFRPKFKNSSEPWSKLILTSDLRWVLFLLSSLLSPFSLSLACPPLFITLSTLLVFMGDFKASPAAVTRSSSTTSLCKLPSVFPENRCHWSPLSFLLKWIIALEWSLPLHLPSFFFISSPSLGIFEWEQQEQEREKSDRRYCSFRFFDLVYHPSLLNTRESCTLARLFVPEGREVYAIYFMSSVKTASETRKAERRGEERRGEGEVSETRERNIFSLLLSETQLQV